MTAGKKFLVNHKVKQETLKRRRGKNRVHLERSGSSEEFSVTLGSERAEEEDEEVVEEEVGGERRHTRVRKKNKRERKRAKISM